MSTSEVERKRTPAQGREDQRQYKLGLKRELLEIKDGMAEVRAMLRALVTADRQTDGAHRRKRGGE
jgi:hypothetical protein